MVKNYLLGSVRPVRKYWYPNERTLDQDNPDSEKAYREYQQMYEISRASAKQFLAGEWEEIRFSAPVLNARMFQIATWYQLREIWFKEPCNILSVSADVIFVKPVSMFGEFDQMMLFNYTDPQTHADLKCYEDGQGHYFNDSVVYFPATMDPAIWELGERRMADWFTHAQADWDCGQLIHNHMYWSQRMPRERRLRSDLNFSAHNLRVTDPAVIAAHERWNHGTTWDQARIMHFAGSRGSMPALEIMRQLALTHGIDHG
jgi:hypothetical protein